MHSTDGAPAGNPGPASAAGILPEFRYVGVILDPAGLRYSPHPDIIHPSVIETGPQWERPLARYYMYYAPHDKPGGIGLAVSESPAGPWHEYDHNPIIARDWPPHYQVSHVSSPNAIWNPEEQRVFLYFHGENDTTRFAVSRDGVHFEYGGVAVNCGMFGPGLIEASYARVFRHGGTGGQGTYVMMVMGNYQGTRNVYIAWSPDGRRWKPERQPLITPPPGTSQVGTGWLFAWNKKFYIICFANRADSPEYEPVSDLYLYEVAPAFNRATFLGMFMHHAVAGADNARINDPCLLQTSKCLYLFVNVGHRKHQRIGLAIADLSSIPMETL